MRYFLTINGTLFLLFFFCSFLPQEGSLFTRLLFSFSALSIVFLLPGWNIMTFVASVLQKKFSLFEFFTLSIAVSCILPALLLVVEYQNIHTISPSLPIINTILIFLATAIYLRKNKTTSLPFDIPEKSKLLSDLKFLALSALLYLSIIGSMVTAYYPLPDLDPYYWLSQSRDFFSRESIPTFLDSRPLFIAFTYLFSVTAQIDLYAYFKYILPLLSTLLIFPALLLTQTLKHPLQKSVTILFPFTSGIVIIFLEESIPQAIASILTFFIIALTLHARSTKSIFFFFSAGSITLLGYFFHEALIIPLLAWILAVCIYFRTSIFHLARKHTIIIALLAIIVLPYLTHIGQYFFNITNVLIHNITNIRPNFLFPQEYINVDGNQMGWGDLFGVAKYYLFYVGPALLLLLILLPIIPKTAWKNFFRSPEGLFLSLSFTFFFLIAEIFPRIIGMAFLPDRAWIFGGVFMLAFFLLLFETTLGKNKFILLLFLIAFSTNIGAALYINTMKKYVITNEQLTSAEWIKTHLPEKRTIFTIESSRLLSFFSGSSVISIKNPNFLFDESIFESEFNTNKKPFSEADQKKAIESLQTITKTINTENPLQGIQETRNILNAIERIEKEKNENKKEANRSYYIYYAAPNEKNPYLDRPYMKKVQNKENEIIFNQYPEKFNLLYSDEKNHIFLWKIL